MGLLQRAIETYDASAALAGVYREGHEPLAPISHITANAHIEIRLNEQGKFRGARLLTKEEGRTVIPVTEDSGGRTNKLAAHPLCDQIKYVASDDEEAHGLYLRELCAWEESAYSHPILSAVRAYVESETIIADLINCGVIKEKARHEDKTIKLLIRWRVDGCEQEEPACWKNKRLFSLYQEYYYGVICDRGQALCMVSGKEDLIATKHPCGIISNPYMAKLISANDGKGFTYRGRFSDEKQAATVGYIASQKAHSALRWLTADQGIREGASTRAFLCWNPEGKAVPQPMRRVPRAETASVRKPSDYKKQLQGTLLSFREDHQLKNEDRAVLVSFDAATTGRLAVTYYNEIGLEIFLRRMEDWDGHCCWYAEKSDIQAPNLLDIVDCAFGVERDKKLTTDGNVLGQHLQRLLQCKVDGGIFPLDILRALTHRASSPLGYGKANWRKIMQTACAALQKYRYDTNQGGNEMAWALDKRDRSFQYGRLLAAMERVEEDYYYNKKKGNGKEDGQENRQTNAIKYMSEFRRRPFSVYERVNRHLQLAYLGRVEPWQAARYKRLVGEIIGILREFPEEELNRPLEDIYLMGYELQRNAFFTKNQTDDNMEEE